MIQSVRSKRKRKDSDDEGEAAEVSKTQISTNFASSYLFNTLNISTALYFQSAFICMLKLIGYAVTCTCRSF